MMMNLLITIFVAILIQVAFGEECINNGTKTTFIQIYNCNSVSYQKLARDFETEEITKFDASERNNEFPTIHNEMFRGINNLEALWLGDCKIEEIDENAFDNLQILIFLGLHKNRIKTLHVNTFSNLGNLKNIYLDENQLKELPAKLFESNKKLRKLYLSSNKIEAVEEGTFDGLTELTVLNLNNNTCINKLYGDNGSNKTICLAQVSYDLSTCYNNYEAYFKTSTLKKLLDLYSKTPTPILIYAAIVTILLIISIIINIKLNAKIKNVDQNRFEMENRVSYHYYSRPDEFTQPNKDQQ